MRRHYYRYLEGAALPPPTPFAIIMAWASALEKRGELDQNKELETFGRQFKKEAAVKNRGRRHHDC